MQTGLVDGNENTESTFFDFKLYEVQKFLTESFHGYVATSSSPTSSGSLPPDIRGHEEAMAGRIYANAISKSANEAALEVIVQRHKETFHYRPQTNEWKKVLRKTHAQMGDRISQPLLQAIYKETGAGKP